MLPYSAIPRGWKWLNRVSPTTWCGGGAGRPPHAVPAVCGVGTRTLSATRCARRILYGLGESQLGDSSVPMLVFGNVRTTVGQFMSF